MANVLFLTQVLPYPLNAGPKVRAYHMLRQLAAHHRVTLVSFVRGDDTPEAIEHLGKVCHTVVPVAIRRSAWRNLHAALKGVVMRLPIVIARDEIGEMSATLRALTGQYAFDIIHADQLSMAGYGQRAVCMGRDGRPRTVLDEHNAVYILTRRMASLESHGLRRLIMAREARALARYEAGMCRAYDAVLTVTKEDLDHLLALYPPDEQAELANKSAIIPICVDPAQVAPVVHREGGAPTILYIGTMFWPPNVDGALWFAREVLPLVRQEVPGARLVLVGKNPTPEIQALAADPDIQVTGYVSDPLPYLQLADAFVVPLRAAGGMRVKILDAWLWGLPIISTPIGAEGIAAQDGENILIARDVPGFARAVVRVLTDPVLNRQLRVTGRAWAESHYVWQAVYGKVDQVYARLLDGHEYSS